MGMVCGSGEWWVWCAGATSMRAMGQRVHQSATASAEGELSQQVEEAVTPPAQCSRWGLRGEHGPMAAELVRSMRTRKNRLCCIFEASALVFAPA